MSRVYICNLSLTLTYEKKTNVPPPLNNNIFTTPRDEALRNMQIEILSIYMQLKSCAWNSCGTIGSYVN